MRVGVGLVQRCWDEDVRAICQSKGQGVLVTDLWPYWVVHV